MDKIKNYVIKTITSKVTWASILAGVPTAAALDKPWSWIAIGLTILGVLAPTP